MPAPNRIALYITAAASLLGGLAPIVGDLDTTSTAGVLVSVAALVALARKFLDGWQAMEKAEYQARLIDMERVAHIEASQAQAEAAAAVSRPGSKAAAIKLPR